MKFEMINSFGHPVQFMDYFLFFTFVLMLYNCICMLMVFGKRQTKTGCPVRLFVNSTIVFLLHLLICGYAWQYSMWIEAEPCTDIIAQIGVMTWLFVTPILYFIIIVSFAVLCIYLFIEWRKLDKL